MISYTVVSGDSLSALAFRYGTNIEAIMEVNQGTIKDKDLIYTGQVINIPEKDTTLDTELIKTDVVKTLFDKCLQDIENLPSFIALMAVLK